MNIRLDNREKELNSQIQSLIQATPSYKDLTMTVENLPLGDAILSYNGEDQIIIERKSVADLMASIKDGRYEEQSYRLDGLSHHNHNIIYLIEGDVKNNLNHFSHFKNANKIDKMTLYSAIFSLNYYKGFSVLRTFNLEETALFICNTANKLKRSINEGRKPYYQTQLKNLTENTPEIEEETKEECDDNQYVNVIKKVKKDNITPENIGSIMLCQIPGISAVTSVAIMNNYKTIPNLIQSLEQDATCLNNITYKTKDVSRKISKSAITNIIKFLLQK
jgi:ERCC4-type nuclease